MGARVSEPFWQGQVGTPTGQWPEVALAGEQGLLMIPFVFGIARFSARSLACLVIDGDEVRMESLGHMVLLLTRWMVWRNTEGHRE